MILVDHMIKAEIERGTLKISPFDESLINPSSLDVRLGQSFYQPEPTYVNIDPTDPLTFRTQKVGDTTFVLKPGDMVLSSLMEHIELPKDISAKILGKSSLGRLGLDNSSVSGWVDAQFKGSLVVELSNHSKFPIVLTKGMKIGQLIFYKHIPCETGYLDKPGSKYGNQRGVQGSKGVN